jgi:hypothetical protein
MLASARVELVQQHRIRGAIFPRELQLGIAEYHFAFVGDAKFRSYLQHDLHFVAGCGHR